MFEDCFDFWDEGGDGWVILTQAGRATRIFCGEGWAEFYRWFVQFSSPDIKANYNDRMVLKLMYDRYKKCRIDPTDDAIMDNPITDDAIRLLLQVGPPRMIDRPLNGPLTALCESVMCRRWDTVRTLLAWGADPHQSSHYCYSQRTQTPLSMAMYSSSGFCAFRDVLHEINPHVEDIVRRELDQGGSLLDDGWQAETLSTLLRLDIEPDIQLYIVAPSCDSCGGNTSFGAGPVQPCWRAKLERIKNGTYVQNARSDNQDVQSPNTQSRPLISNNVSDYIRNTRPRLWEPVGDLDSLPNTTNGGVLQQDPNLPDDQSIQSDEEPVTTEIWCWSCWVQFKRFGRPQPPRVYDYTWLKHEPADGILDVTETLPSYGDDPSENEFSPFLFNT